MKRILIRILLYTLPGWILGGQGQSLQGTVLNQNVHLACPVSISARTGENLMFRCRIINQGIEPVYFVSNFIILEGPQTGAPYVYFYVGGERYENVLQYNVSPKRLDLPVLFKPTIHLQADELRRLVKIPSKGAGEVKIEWKLLPDSLPGKTVFSRVKLIYVSNGEILSLLSGSELREGCRRQLSESIARARKGMIDLDARRNLEGRGYSFDGCRDVISERFQHLYSNTIKVQIKKSKS